MRLLAAALLVLAAPAAAKPPAPLFASAEPLRIGIAGPIAGLGAAPAGKTVDGTLTAGGAALPIKLSARGITRRLKTTCPFPPLRVEFAAPPPAASPFAGQKSLKLVTHCRPEAGFQQYTLLEYAAYRLYNVLTPVSFDARLATIDYAGPDGRPAVTRTGFFIESTGAMAHRNGLDDYKTTVRIPSGRLDPTAAARFALFEDLISNLDWAMTAGPDGDECCHNSKPVAAKGATTGFLPVPYDFDLSGLVDAPYALAPAQLHLSNVRIHRYRGYCAHNPFAEKAAADMVAKRAELLGVLDATPGLTAKSRQKAAAYLGGFLDQIATPDGLAKVLSTCLS